MTLEETETKYGVKVKQIESIEEFLKDKKETLLVRGEDSAIDKLVEENTESEKEFLNYISVMRAVKDKYEIDEMQNCLLYTSPSPRD